jgi:rubrerythrin
LSDGLSGGYDKLSGEVGRLSGGYDKLSGEVGKLSRDVARMEHGHGQKLEALLDGYKHLAEKQQEHDRCFDRLEKNLERQDVEIRVIKGGFNP